MFDPLVVNVCRIFKVIYFEQINPSTLSAYVFLQNFWKEKFKIKERIGPVNYD